MKLRNKIITTLLIINIIVFNIFTINAYALQPSTNVNVTISDPSQFPFNFWTIDMLRKVGILYNPTLEHPTLEDYANQINQVDDQANVSDETSVKNWFIDNSTVTQDSNNNTVVNINGNYKDVLKGIGNLIIANSGFVYAYSWDIRTSVPIWQSGTYFNKAKSLIEQYQDSYYVYLNTYSDTFDGAVHDVLNLVLVPISDDCQFCKYIGPWDAVYVGLYHWSTWEGYNANNDNIIRKVFYISEGEWVEASNVLPYVPNIHLGMYNLNMVDGFPGYGTSETCPATSGKKNTYKIWNSVNEMKLGTQGYSSYYTSSNWKDFSKNNSDNYTVDSSNSNNITYGDVNNWINNYYTDNNTYPDPTQINVYIDGGNGGST